MRNRLTACVVLGALALTGRSVPAQNLITNGGFEGGWSGVAPTAWTTFWCGQDWFYSPCGDVAHSGSYSLPLRHMADYVDTDSVIHVYTLPGYEQAFAVDPAASQLHFECWYLSYQGGKINIRIRERNGDPSYYPRYYDGTVPGWQTPSGNSYICYQWRNSTEQGDGYASAFCHTMQVTGQSWWQKAEINVPVLSGVTSYMLELMADLPDQGLLAMVDDVVVSPIYPPAVLAGTIALQNFAGDNASLSATFTLRPVGGGDAIVGQSYLTGEGAFSVQMGDVPTGQYDVAVQVPLCLTTVVPNVTVSRGVTTTLDPIVVRAGDSNGDDQVSFEDFAILQNVYGQRGPIVVPHVVDGVCSPGEWGTLYADPVGDTSGGVELVRWGAEVRDGVLYAAFELDPNGPTVAQYNDPANGKNIWLSLWLDVDPATDPATGVPEGDSQFAPRTQDIYIELGTDQGTLEGSNGWHSLNLWGDSDNFSKFVPVTGSFAYSDYIVEFSCPVSAILAELPNTDGAVPASVWKVAARAAGQGFGGDYSGDITVLKSLGISDPQGGTPQANPLVPAAAAIGGCGGLGIALLSFLGLTVLALRSWNE